MANRTKFSNDIVHAMTLGIKKSNFILKKMLASLKNIADINSMGINHIYIYKYSVSDVFGIT
jgi:CO dehydrogenase/acetyl-CoA synthase epsilon subunit